MDEKKEWAYRYGGFEVPEKPTRRKIRLLLGPWVCREDIHQWIQQRSLSEGQHCGILLGSGTGMAGMKESQGSTNF